MEQVLEKEKIKQRNETIDEKTTHRMGENICRQIFWQGINLQNL